MGTTYNTRKAVPAGRSVFIATASYDAIKAGYAFSLAKTTAELARYGIQFELAVMEGNCHVDDGRNMLVREFMNGNCTDMLFIDGDLMWNADDVLKLLADDGDLVAGAYPLKSSSGRFPIGQIFHEREDGLLEVSYAPTGFMRIRRNVFDTLWPTQSKFGVEKPMAVYFERKFNGNTRDGGDVNFCRKWIAAGGKVLVNPDITFSHIGEHRWTGNFRQYLAKEENITAHAVKSADPNQSLAEDSPVTHNTEATIADCLAKLRAGDESPATFAVLCDLYGNKPWAATPEFLHAAFLMAKSLPAGAKVFECGSGLSTAVLAASGADVVCVEEHGEWARKTCDLLNANGLDANVLVSKMNCQWFAGADEILAGVSDADMIVIDGPRRREGIDRLFPLAKMKAGTSVIVDDVETISLPGEWVGDANNGRPFIAGRLG